MPNDSMISPDPVRARVSADRPSPILDFVNHRITEPAQFPKQEGLIQLNNGSYGLTPLVVRDAQRELQRRLEADPVRFFKSDLEHYSDDTRHAIANFVRVAPENLALVSNGTFAVATVLNNLKLNPGDEILVTDHEYMATFNELEKICKPTGAKAVIAKIPFPTWESSFSQESLSEETIVEALVSKMSSRTKLVMISHIASASAIILPVKRIVEEAKSRGIDTFVDGAHTPGQIDLNISEIDPTWYAASCHKWLACPKGTGFICTSPNKQDGFVPMVLSCRVHEKRVDRAAYLCDFDYTGTNDYTGNLVIPVAIEHMGHQLPGGWEQLYSRNHDLVVQGAQLVCEAIGIKQHIPESMIGTMVSIPLPGSCQQSPSEHSVMGEALWDRLYLNHRIQVPIWDLPGVCDRMMRVSAQLFNTLDDFHALADALREELR